MQGAYLPGDYICDSEGFIKAHGTEQRDGKIYSAHFGTVSQIDKLVTVIPFFSIRYTPEIGDVVIGRVIQIYNKKWKVDANAKGDTSLSLNAINLPGVMQRRKSEDDEMNMSNYFNVNDLIVCEVQKVTRNGSAALHTRSDKYGRLTDGILVVVSPDMLAPMKSRFISKGSIEIVGGCNGYIWISSKTDDVSSIQLVAQIKSVIENLYDNGSVIDLDTILNCV